MVKRADNSPWYWTTNEQQEMWRIWFECAPPDAQVAIDAALQHQKLRWEIPPVFKTWHTPDTRCGTCEFRVSKPDSLDVHDLLIKFAHQNGLVRSPFNWNNTEYHLWYSIQHELLKKSFGYRQRLITAVFPTVCQTLLPWQYDGIYTTAPDPTWLDWALGFRTVNRAEVFKNRQAEKQAALLKRR